MTVNTLSLYRMPTGQYATQFCFIDGSSMWELQNNKLVDTEILTKVLQKKYYQHLPGPWEILLPGDHKSFEDDLFAKAIQATLLFIYERDNPCWPEAYY